ncbi:peptidase inhibitor [Streptomyces scabiei]|uniref:peptidase inhibitor n=1 Tax=Streptomyces scabiei TaxID=1930 RepID=UPI00299F9BC1|nr:peptidase inhibitor [Streptomyces scabiei]MDX3521283.1 peptidase inhibitor [Streptomyces scabiei]
MSVKIKIFTMASAVALSIGGVAVTASSAEAVGGCPSAKLCLYRSTEYRTLSFAAASTGACFTLSDYGLSAPGNGIMSYVNNLPVKATIWNSQNLHDWYADATIRPGGYSSDTGSNFPFHESYKICTGNALPYSG